MWIPLKCAHLGHFLNVFSKYDPYFSFSIELDYCAVLILFSNIFEADISSEDLLLIYVNPAI